MSNDLETRTVTVNAALLEELHHIAEQHRKHGAPNPQETTEGLIQYILSAVVDGYRRPWLWEATLVEMMGLEPYAEDPWDDCSEEGDSDDSDLDDEEDYIGYDRPLPARGEYGARCHPMAGVGPRAKAKRPFFTKGWQFRGGLLSRYVVPSTLKYQQSHNRHESWRRFCKKRPAQAAFMVDWPAWTYISRRKG